MGSSSPAYVIFPNALTDLTFRPVLPKSLIVVLQTLKEKEKTKTLKAAREEKNSTSSSCVRSSNLVYVIFPSAIADILHSVAKVKQLSLIVVFQKLKEKGKTKTLKAAWVEKINNNYSCVRLSSPAYVICPNAIADISHSVVKVKRLSLIQKLKFMTKTLKALNKW